MIVVNSLRFKHQPIGVENARILKQERSAEESWRSCGVDKAVELSGMVESEPVSSPVNTAQVSSMHDCSFGPNINQESAFVT